MALIIGNIHFYLRTFYKRRPHKMVKHTQTIRRQQLATADELFECVWSFCGVGTWRINCFYRTWVIKRKTSFHRRNNFVEILLNQVIFMYYIHILITVSFGQYQKCIPIFPFFSCKLTLMRGVLVFLFLYWSPEKLVNDLRYII